MKAALRGLLTCLALSCGGNTLAQGNNSLVLRMGEGRWPVWQGMGVGESSLNMGNMMYPGGGGLEGFLAAVITHGLLLHGSRTAMRNEQQAKADQVLRPHGPAIDGLTPERLLSGARERLSSDDRQRPQVLELRPSYAMSSDERTLVLDNAIRLVPPQGTPLDRVIRVIAPALLATDPTAQWQLDQGQPLQQQASAMLAHSIQLALSVSPATAAGKPSKTLRYRTGATETMERGKLLALGCDRIIMETLRGWILSAPRSDSKPEDCALRPYAFEAEAFTAAAAAPLPHPAAAAADPVATPAAPAVPVTPPH